MIAADKARQDRPCPGRQSTCAIDLAGRDIVDAVKTSVDPKVIDCPHPSSSASPTIDAVAKRRHPAQGPRPRDGPRTNIERLVGGATEETIIARVGEGIVSAIGSSETHKDVLENPDKHLQGRALGKGLDSGTAFEILSIDIADVDVGREHRRRAPGRPGRGGQEAIPGRGREAPRPRGRPGGRR